MSATQNSIIPRHLWTNGGEEVMVVRFVNADGSSSKMRFQDGKSVETDTPFVYPLTVGCRVFAPDWNPTPVCGGGLHGWPWGFSLGDGKDCDWSATWLVFGVRPDDVIPIDGKIKFRTGVLRFVGSWSDAMLFVLDGQMAWVRHASSGAATASGDSGAATASGYSGAATASGDSGAATASGDSGAATASGYSGAATAKDKALSAVVTGLNGRARAPEFGFIALAWWNETEARTEMRCSLVGNKSGQLKPNTWYMLDERGEFEEQI